MPSYLVSAETVKQDFGLTRILYIIFVLKFTEPEAEAEVKLQ